MDPNLLRQLAKERSMRTGELERYAAQSAEFEKMNKRFDLISRKLIKHLKESIADLKKFQQQCIKGKLTPEVNKIVYAIRLLKERSAQEIIQSIDTMRATINKINAERNECQEEAQANYDLYIDISAKEDTLKTLSPEKYAQYAVQLQNLKAELQMALDEVFQASLAEFNRAKDLIFQYFFQLNELVQSGKYTFNVIDFNEKYRKVKETYLRVFGEELPVDILFAEMYTAEDEAFALRLARQLELEG